MDIPCKVAIVTGAGVLGSGRAIARRLAENGASVIVADINDDGGRETRRLIEAEGGRAAFVHADVRHEAEVQSLIASTERAFGGLDILVNNASGGQFPKSAFDHGFANLSVDLLGAIYAMRYGIEAMRRRKGGAIVNIGSVSALIHGGRRRRSWVRPALNLSGGRIRTEVLPSLSSLKVLGEHPDLSRQRAAP